MKKANKLEHTLKCDVCNSGMNEGFYVSSFVDEYFCKKKCLHSKYSKREYNKMYTNDIAFWTTWYPA
jgi:hypothetical protein